MRHFSEEGDFTGSQELFYIQPEEFNKDTSKELLKYSLGGTLYIPAIRPDLLSDVRKMRAKGASSVVICLEDSIPDERVDEAEANLHKFLLEISEVDGKELPLIFVRPRTPEHLARIIEKNTGLLGSLTGFVYPKFDDLDERGKDFLKVHRMMNRLEKTKLYYMPVIESPSVVHRETRKITLNNVSSLLSKYEKELLAVRIGVTDMSSVYGLRRNRDFTVYDVHVVSSVIADIVNVLGRADDGRVITGPVWEHFNPTIRTFKPSLRESIFDGDEALRKRLLTEGLDTFIREIQLDKLNGLTGKTLIHPSHIPVINSLLVVTHEEYHDAADILGNETGGGAYSSLYKNKMNEVKPHYSWAKAVEARAKMFGVSNEGVDFIDILEGFNK